MEGQGLRVLLVEDDPEDSYLLREMLADVPAARIELAPAESLAAALERLREGRFDVALADLTLPDSTGLETFEEIHRASSGTPVVVLTGLDDETVAVRAVQAGAQDYLVKGQVTGPLLVRSLRYAIERQRTSYYQALLVERERFDAAVSQMSDGIVVVDRTWRLTTANRAACLLLNLPPDAWLGAPLADALRPFELSRPIEELLASSQRADAFEITRPDTSPPLYLDARLTRLFDAVGGLDNALLVVRDVTQERREQELRADFLMLVSHKLRTPLTVVIACLDVWHHLWREGRIEEAVRVLEVCRGEVTRLTSVVQALLDFKALQERDLEALGEPGEVAAVVAGALERVTARHPGKRTEITTEIAEAVGQAACNVGSLGLVLDNVLDNAVKFGDKDPVRVSVRIAALDDDGGLDVSVSDNGPGIPHEYYDRIFDGFVQVEDLPTGQVPGLGVGLYLMRQLVRASGGEVSVRSTIGEGATFSFTLPRRP